MEGHAVVDDILRSQAAREIEARRGIETHTMVMVGYTNYTVKDVRTSGGTLRPKTRNEEFGRSREIVILPIIIIPHFHPGRSPFLPRSHARPFGSRPVHEYIDIDDSDHRRSAS